MLVSSFPFCTLRLSHFLVQVNVFYVYLQFIALCQSASATNSTLRSPTARECTPLPLRPPCGRAVLLPSSRFLYHDRRRYYHYHKSHEHKIREKLYADILSYKTENDRSKHNAYICKSHLHSDYRL